MEPASSSEDESDSDSSASDIKEQTNSEPNQNTPPSFEDLPTDDSGSELSTSDEEESDSDDESDDSSTSQNDQYDNDQYDNEDVPLEERLKFRENSGRKPNDNNNHNKKKTTTTTSSKKKSKHAPTEASSKRSEHFRRGVPLLDSSGLASESTGIANKYKARDPRLDHSLSGHFDQGAFEHNYSFLGDMQKQEIQRLKNQVAARKLKGQKGRRERRRLNMDSFTTTAEEDQEELSRLLQLTTENKKSKGKRDLKSSMKQKMREEIKSGKRKKEYHYKKKDWKRVELGAKYDELKKKGGDAAIDKLLVKRRKKNTGKDGKYMPSKGWVWCV